MPRRPDTTYFQPANPGKTTVSVMKYAVRADGSKRCLSSSLLALEKADIVYGLHNRITKDQRAELLEERADSPRPRQKRAR